MFVIFRTHVKPFFGLFLGDSPKEGLYARLIADSTAGGLTVRATSRLGWCGKGRTLVQFVDYWTDSVGGCEEVDCCRTVCQVDAFCCDVTWDGFCAGSADGLCYGSFDSCGLGAGDCSIGNDTPGCDDVDCCNAVCGVDPYCCTTECDEFCAAPVPASCP